MKENEYQERIAKLITTQEAKSLKATLTENHDAVIVQIGEYDAAYTADEALALADFLEENQEKADAAEYIRKMTRIVDDLYGPDYIDEDIGEYRELKY